MDRRDRDTRQVIPGEHQQRLPVTPTGAAPGYRMRKVQSLPAQGQMMDYVWDESQQKACIWNGSEWVCFSNFGGEWPYDYVIALEWLTAVGAGTGVQNQEFTGASGHKYRISWSLQDAMDDAAVRSATENVPVYSFGIMPGIHYNFEPELTVPDVNTGTQNGVTFEFYGLGGTAVDYSALVESDARIGGFEITNTASGSVSKPQLNFHNISLGQGSSFGALFSDEEAIIVHAFRTVFQGAIESTDSSLRMNLQQCSVNGDITSIASQGHTLIADNCKFSGNIFAAIDWGSEWSFDNCRFSDDEAEVVLSSGGVLSSLPGSLRIVNCRFPNDASGGNAASCIRTGGTVTGPFENINISNNTFERTPQSGEAVIDLNFSGNGDGNGIVISDNTFWGDFSSALAANTAFIRITTSAGGKCYRPIIQGNVFGGGNSSPNDADYIEDEGGFSVIADSIRGSYGPNVPANKVQYNVSGTDNEFYPTSAAVGTATPSNPAGSRIQDADNTTWVDTESSPELISFGTDSVERAFLDEFGFAPQLYSGYDDTTVAVIAGGVITLGSSFQKVDTQASAATDDLDTITPPHVGLPYFAFIKPNDGARTIVIKHNTGNIQCVGGADITLDDIYEQAILIYDTVSGDWTAQMGVPGGGGGGSALTVKEEDGAPSDAAVVEIQVPNGTLTVDAAGVVSLGYEVAGAVAGHVLAADPHGVYALDTDLATHAGLGTHHTIHDEVAAALTNRAALHFQGKGIQALDNGGSTRTEVVVGRYYDAIVDASDTNAIGKNNVYDSIQDAITAGAVAIFVRGLTADAANITIAAGDSVRKIIGETTQTAIVPVNIECNKDDVLFESLCFAVDATYAVGTHLVLNGARNTAFACLFIGTHAVPTAAINDAATPGITAVQTTIPYDTGVAGLLLPTAGFIQIDDEVIGYTGGGGATSGTLTGCVRQQHGTLGVTHGDNAIITGLTHAALMVMNADCTVIQCRFLGMQTNVSLGNKKGIHCLAIFSGGARTRVVSNVFLNNTVYDVIGMFPETNNSNEPRGVQLVSNAFDGNSAVWFQVCVWERYNSRTAINTGAPYSHIYAGNFMRNLLTGGFHLNNRIIDIAGNMIDGGTRNVRTAAINDNVTPGITAVQTTIPYDTAAGGGSFPERGVIMIENELIAYGSFNGTQFLNCVRGYCAGSGAGVAATHGDNIAITDVSQRAISQPVAADAILLGQGSLISGNVIQSVKVLCLNQSGCSALLWTGNLFFPAASAGSSTQSFFFLGNGQILSENLYGASVTIDFRSIAASQKLLGGLSLSVLVLANLAADTLVWMPAATAHTGVNTATYLIAGQRLALGRVAGDATTLSAPLTNRTGANSVAGNVVCLDAANASSFVQLAVAASPLVAGVVVVGAVANLADDLIATGGTIVVNCDTAAVAIGALIVTSALTAGLGAPAAAPANGTIIGKALTAKAGGANGPVTVRLMTG